MSHLLGSIILHIQKWSFMSNFDSILSKNFHFRQNVTRINIENNYTPGSDIPYIFTLLLIKKCKMPRSYIKSSIYNLIDFAYLHPLCRKATWAQKYPDGSNFGAHRETSCLISPIGAFCRARDDRPDRSKPLNAIFFFTTIVDGFLFLFFACSYS